MNDQNVAYLVRGEQYKLRDFVLDGLLAMGSGFNPHSQYNTRKLVVPGRFVMGNFEQGNANQLVLKDDVFFIDRTLNTLVSYDRQIRKGNLVPEQQWLVSDDMLRVVVEQLEQYMFALRHEKPLEQKARFQIHWPILKPTY